MKKGKKLISLLLGLIMILSLTPTAAAMGGVNVAANEMTSIPTDKGHVKATELIAMESEDAPNDVGSLSLAGSSLNTQGASRSGAQTARGAMTTDEQRYTEDVAKSLAKPIGAVDVIELPAEEPAGMIVWLQQLPTVLAEFYGEAAANALTKDYAEQGAQARRSIRTSYADDIVWEYSAVFAGFAMNLLPSEALELAKMPGVYAVTPDTMLYADTAIGYDDDYQYAGMKESREIFNVAEIHNAGVTGNGVIVGVLDTGIDYNHPDLAGVYKGGYNYITTSADYGREAAYRTLPMETTYAQWQASGKAETNANGNEFYTSHGTHVSGTVAAQAKNDNGTYRTLGLAPEVDLYVARVLGPYGSGATSGIISAIEDFTVGNASRGIPKANVINLSLGADTNTPYGSDIYALNNAVIGGVNVSVSAGNNATPSGNSTMEARRAATLGSPGTAYLPVTVAAAQYGGTAVRTYDAVSASLGGEASTLSFGLLLEGQDVSNAFANNSITGNPSPVYVEGKGYEAYLGFGANDANTLAELEAIPAGSLAGKVLFVKRGLAFTDFLAQALRTGAGALVVVNSAANGEAYITNMAIGGINAGSLPIFSAYHSTSAKLTTLAAGGRTVYVQLGDLTAASQAKLPAYFSSIGPVNTTIGLKPDIIAPGWSIISTAPAFISTTDHNTTDYSAAYQSMSGTSMSAPHMCGVLALMVDAYPNATPAEIKARLMNTAQPDLIDALANGTPASVLEVGAGFVDPYRAIMQGTDVYVTVKDDIPGASSGTVIANQTLSSLSFGAVSAGTSSRTLPVTVHGASSFDVSVVYNDVTRYSKNATQNGVALKYDAAANGTFNAWVEIPASAEQGYYEGWLKITAGGKEYTLPWLVLVGAASMPFDVLGTAERPIISTSTSNSVRASGGSNPANSNATSLWFTWEGGEWPQDYGATTQRLMVYLIDTATESLAYRYNSVVNLAGVSNDGTDVYVIANMLAHQARKITDGAVEGTNSDIANGTYYLGIAAGGTVYYYYELGIVFTNGTGDSAVQFNMEPTVLVDPDPATLTAKVSGRIYSPALAAADAAGFLWTEVDDFWVNDKAYIIDQTWNVLGYSVTTASGVYISAAGTAYNLFLDSGNPWICDEDGYFSLTLPVTQAAKSGGWPFTNGTNHAVVGVEGFYYNDNNSSWPLVGGNKSAPVTPVYAHGPTINALTATNGSLAAAIANLPANVKLSDFKAEVSIGGGDYAPLTLTGMSGNLELTFDALPQATYEQSATVRLSYLFNAMTADFTIPPVVIKSVTADNDTGTLAIAFDAIPLDAPTESMLAVAWDIAPDSATTTLTGFAYDAATGVATYSFTPLAPADWEQTVTFHVTFNGVTTDSNTVVLGGEVTEPISIVYYNTGTVSVPLNKKITLEILTEPVVDLSNYTITWTSVNPAVASVNGAGVVTGKKAGITTVTATIFNPYGEVSTLDFTVRVY